MSVSTEDRAMMGTEDAARDALVTKLREWRTLRQPVIASKIELKARELRERQLRFEICNAGLHWLWHVENPFKAR